MFERDFLVTTSRLRFLILRLAVVLVAAVVVATVAIVNVRRPPDTVGRYVLGAAAAVLPALVLLIAPAAAAPCFTSEREGGTLDLVRAAPGNALTLVLAKFSSRFLGALVLVFAVLPVAAVALVYGGVGIADFLDVVLLAVVFAASGTAAGVLTSARARTSAGAVVGAYVLVFLVPALPWAVLIPVFTAHHPSAPVLSAFLATQPTVTWLSVVSRFLGGPGAPDILGVHAAIVAGAVVIALWAATRRMSREGVVPSGPARRQKARRRSFFLDSPILDRGVRGTLLTHPTASAWAVPLLATAAVGLHVWLLIEERHSRRDDSYIVLLGSITLLAMLQVLAAASASIAVERRNGSLDVLLATPYRRATIVRHRTAAAVLTAVPTLALPALHGVFGCLLAYLHPLVFATWIAVTAVLLTFTAALGVRVSVAARSPGGATLRAFAIAIGGLAILALVLFLLALASVDGHAIAVVAASAPVALPYLVPGAVADVVSRGFRANTTTSWAALMALIVDGCLAAALVASAVRTLQSKRE